jgi:hypothetical protein
MSIEFDDVELRLNPKLPPIVSVMDSADTVIPD